MGEGEWNEMTDARLCEALDEIDLANCRYIFDDIYYIKTKLKIDNTGNEFLDYGVYEFLIITDNMVKKAIILNCDDIDLHWYVHEKWRNKHVLSNALRTGIIRYMWPNVKWVTCCYDNDLSDEEICNKYRMTYHLARICGLKLVADDNMISYF